MGKVKSFKIIKSPMIFEISPSLFLDKSILTKILEFSSVSF